MKLYFVRHGQTPWNAANRVLGRTDIPLNETGLAQAAVLAEKLSHIKMDAIYVSPLSRARETAQIIWNNQPGNPPLRVKENLIEQNFGIFEGQSRTDATYQAEKRKYFMRLPEGESYFDVVARVYPLIEELKRMHKNDNVLLVTHGGIGRIIANYFVEMENEEFASFVMDNCEVKMFEG